MFWLICKNEDVCHHVSDVTCQHIVFFRDTKNKKAASKYKLHYKTTLQQQQK